LFSDFFFHLPPHHHRHDGFRFGLGDAHRPDFPPVPQDGDAVTNGEHFPQPMRHIQHRRPAFFEAADDVVKFLRLRFRQGGGRFVHDEDAGVLGEGFGNFHQLLLADGQLPHFCVGVNGFV
jgi:hypothetical protein